MWITQLDSIKDNRKKYFSDIFQWRIKYALNDKYSPTPHSLPLKPFDFSSLEEEINQVIHHHSQQKPFTKPSLLYGNQPGSTDTIVLLNKWAYLIQHLKDDAFYQIEPHNVPTIGKDPYWWGFNSRKMSIVNMILVILLGLYLYSIGVSEYWVLFLIILVYLVCYKW